MGRRLAGAYDTDIYPLVTSPRGHCRRRLMMRRLVAAVAALTLLAAACSGTDSAESDSEQPVDLTEDTAEATFDTAVGVEQVTVTGAEAGEALTLVDGTGDRQVTMVADALGQAHFAYLPAEHATIVTGPDAEFPDITAGGTVEPGEYSIWSLDGDKTATEQFTVPGRDDVPGAEHFTSQDLTVDCPEIEETRRCYTYVEMRDGVELSATIRLPDPGLWGDGPYPTVIEYSGYSPSRPDGDGDPGTMIAGLLGYATVGVNLRGSGCSGGVFDIFNPAQQADGYDVVETVAAQPWVEHGHVGMVGVSYPAITQLYTASTAPPSLAGITPFSVIRDTQSISWPGGIYNSGFTKSWVSNRDSQAAAGGTDWASEIVEGGDETCGAHMDLRNQNPDFEELVRALEFPIDDLDDRDLRQLIGDIEVPTFLAGAWQDEQTGPHFGTMLDGFTGTDQERIALYNGHHPDSILVNLYRWYEFLEFYVAERTPALPDLFRGLAASLGEDIIGVPIELEEDRFTEYATYEEALAAYEAEPKVRVLFENGMGDPENLGLPLARFEAAFDEWPPPGVETASWFLAPDGALAAEPGGAEQLEAYDHDPDAGATSYLDGIDYGFVGPVPLMNWEPLTEGSGLSYVSDPFVEDTVLAGPGYVTVWFSSEAEDANVEVNLSEVRPDGTEYRVQSGWIRAGHRTPDERYTDDLRYDPTYAADDFESLVPGEFVELKIPVLPFAHPFRAGSQLRLTIETPGGNTPLWLFENPTYDGDVSHQVSSGGETPSELVLMVLDGIEVPADAPPCPSLRGQACRDYVEVDNSPAG